MPHCTEINSLEYHTVAGQSATVQICKKGELRIGIFFDGTGNDDENPEEYSNVKKLFDVYPEKKYSPEGEEKKGIDSAYVRGVGSRKDTHKLTPPTVAGSGKEFDESKDYEADSFMGGAWGAAGFKRINHMVDALQKSMAAFKGEHGCLPKRINLDIFGFSRGAIQARHFANVMIQGFYQFNGAYISYEPKDFTVKSLNIFDSVSSFGILTVARPNAAPLDLGWAYHVPKAKVLRTIHLVADDEYRMNFDGQTADGSQNFDYPENIESETFKELVYLGAHSDIGGGYRMKHHGRSSNHLARIYLNKMYDLAHDEGKGVPFLPKPAGGVWEVSKELNTLFDNIQDYYKRYKGSNPEQSLKIAHKKFRERMGYLYKADIPQAPAYQLQQELTNKLEENNLRIERLHKERKEIVGDVSGWKILYKRPSRSDLYRTGKALYDLETENKNIKQQQLVYIEIKKAFNGNKDDYAAFMQIAIEFHNTYVHKSHSAAFKKDYDAEGKETGSNREKLGMGAVIDGKGEDKYLHRNTYYQKPDNVVEKLCKKENAKKLTMADVIIPFKHDIKTMRNATFYQWAIAKEMKS